jgi:hypothetical protein
MRISIAQRWRRPLISLATRGFNCERGLTYRNAGIECDAPPRQVLALQTRTLVSDSAARMRSELASYGITFEGDTLPVSLMPTIVPTEDVIGVAEAGRVVRRAFAGLVSRSHTDQVFNVGNGGRESVVLIAG